MKAQLFHSTFEIKDIDPHGKKFDRVSRIKADSETVDVEILLDVNTEIYPLNAGDKITFALASTLSMNPDSMVEDDSDMWRGGVSGAEPSLADDYEYVMFGKVYKYEDSGSASKVSVYASFGGLLLCISGDYRQLNDLDVGMPIYLLMKK
ncbi:hypothetical protein HDU85_006922 [Gaertneriomyces sp. JEL0708]|nr:RNA polymerase [Gaertneriomyces semiglobifer]KAJ3186886.1 hypothetical protein HDU85_006922 [Gaertneriomyces sp. JEL0708]